jgi:capsular exopolysaccharide synthesis family protein
MEEMGVLTPEQLFRVLSQSGDLAELISEDAIRLAARLRSSTSKDESVITVTAAANDEGVTTVATQLAAALALMTPGDVLLVDANSHEPQIHRNFDIKQSPGFTDIIEGRAGLDQACQRTEIPGLWVLPAGGYVADHLYTVMNEACSQVLMDLRNKAFRYIIIDTAPILGYSDTAVMASRSDATIMVVHADKRRKEEVLEMKRILEGLQVKILGALLRE